MVNKLIPFIIICFLGCTGTPGKTKLTPVIDSEWWRICDMPDLGELQCPDPEKQHIVDHGFILAANGKWQMWACIRGTAAGRLLYGWEGASLETGPWKPLGVTARADSSFGEQVYPEESIQAPYFRKEGDEYLCFYNSNGIRIMTSSDGVHYVRKIIRDNNNLLYAEGGRDVMVMKEGETWFAYSTISTVAADGWKSGFVILRTSPDLVHWSDYTIVSSGGVGGNGHVSAESPFVLKIDGYYYLFRASSITFRTYVYRSETPWHFGVNDDSKLITEFPVKAPEIILFNGHYYISDLADWQGIKLARLKWIKD
jgi:beta-fructofuranosidase